jgi:hypothetical protein
MALVFRPGVAETACQCSNRWLAAPLGAVFLLFFTYPAVCNVERSLTSLMQHGRIPDRHWSESWPVSGTELR